MKTKIFVLVGLSMVVLTSMFLVSNVFAQQAILTTDITSSMYVGSSWSISFTGLNAGEKVYVTGGKVFNGVAATTPVLMGTADANGNLNLGGTHYPNVVGDWQTNWTRADGTVIKSLNFSVLPIPPNGGTVDPNQYTDYTALAPIDKYPFPFQQSATGAYPFVVLPYGVLSPDISMQGWYIAVLAAAQKIDPNATISRKTGMATVTVNGRPILLTGMMKGTLITSEQISQVLASTPPPAYGISTRSMTSQEIADFMKANPDYVNPYLMFTTGGFFGDSSTWSYQKHYWYDPTYQTHTGQPCPGDYCLGAADAHRDPFTDLLNCSSDTIDISSCGRIDSKGDGYSPFASFPYYISGPTTTDNLAKDALGFGEPYMAPDILAGKLMLRAYPSYHVCESVGGCEIGAYVRKAVHAYIIPKLPAYVPPPAPNLSGTVISGEAYKTYLNSSNARQAYLKAAAKVVVDAVQQVQLTMGSASDQGAAARAFISQWNKDPLPTATTITPPSSTPGCTSAGAFSITTGKPCVTTSSEPGCTSAGPYNTMTGRLCGTSIVPGCIPGYLFSPLSGNSCSGAQPNIGTQGLKLTQN